MEPIRIEGLLCKLALGPYEGVGDDKGQGGINIACDLDS